MTEPRDDVIKALYEVDRLGLERLAPDSDLTGKARRLTEGVLEHAGSLDPTLNSASEGWPVDRMPVIDRAILRLGLYELRHEKSTPTGVVLAEAVRLAREFSTEKSGSFVNGVLATLAASERPN